MCVAPPPSEDAVEKLSKEERAGYKRFEDFSNLGNAYAREHGTRPATVGLVLSSSPIAQLAWSVSVEPKTSLHVHIFSLLLTRRQDWREVHPVV